MRQTCLRSGSFQSLVSPGPGPSASEVKSWDISGLEQVTSYTGASVALNSFCGWRNVEGEVLSTPSILCPARHAIVATVPVRTTNISRDAVYVSLFRDVGWGWEAEVCSWFVNQMHYIFFLSLLRKTGERNRNSLRNGKEMAFDVRQAWVWI